MNELYSKDYFHKGYMKFYSDEKETTFQSNESYSYRLSLIEKYKKGGRLLDIGCAAGGFIKTVQGKGWEVFGVELSRYAAESGIKNHELNIFTGTLEEAHFHDSHFDVVSAGDVLEHVPDPASFLGEIKRILKPDGIVYIAVPNFQSFHYHTMSFIAKFNNKNYFVLPHHLYHFSPATLSRLLEITGFEIVEKISSESRLLETGFKRLIMKCIFHIGRLLNMQDRMLVIAKKA
jgi:2-polyprenyl-3-methyl-5-hydroxy-6-metoxy-1,4-benzoquinol methylase